MTIDFINIRNEIKGVKSKQARKRIIQYALNKNKKEGKLIKGITISLEGTEEEFKDIAKTIKDKMESQPPEIRAILERVLIQL